MDQAWTSSCRKLNRAAEHFEALESEIRPYIRDGSPFEYRAEMDVEEGRFRVRIVGGNPPPPNASLIVGDFVQNLRASLDHLICAAVEANGQQPTRQNSFPILSSPLETRRSKDAWERQLKGISKQALPLIDRVQPFRQGERAAWDALACLQALSNEDKHQLVLQTLKAVPNPDEAAPDLDFEVEDLEPIESYELHAMKPLASGDVVMEASIKVIGSKPNVRVRGHLPVELAFGESQIPGSGLAQMFDRIDIIVAHLSNELLGADLRPEPLGVRLGKEAPEGQNGVTGQTRAES